MLLSTYFSRIGTYDSPIRNPQPTFLQSFKTFRFNYGKNCLITELYVFMINKKNKIVLLNIFNLRIN